MGHLSGEEARALVARRLRTQGRACEALGSALYGHLLEEAALDVERAGPVWRVLEGHETDPGPPALALRLLGAVHRLALEGRAPSLAAHYPSCGGDGDPVRAWPAFQAVIAAQAGEVRPLVNRGVQTNEVGRAAALLGGFLVVARQTRLPLRILEIGCSAGLNLRWDHFRYQAGRSGWGPVASPLVLQECFTGNDLPPFDVATTVAVRRGCDRSPIDASSSDGRLSLLCYVWPDQLERIARLRAALAVASAVPAEIDEADAPGWLAGQLDRGDGAGLATVVFHSVFMQYLTEQGRGAVISTIEEAGAAASARAPVAWLRMEPAKPDFEVRLTCWPGGAEELLATSGAHGQDVRWLTRST
jgi:hypothetical protein